MSDILKPDNIWKLEKLENIEAIILIREACKMVSNQTIYNCWKKAGILDCEEKEEEIDCLIEKGVTKYTYALDEHLKMI